MNRTIAALSVMSLLALPFSAPARADDEKPKTDETPKTGERPKNDEKKASEKLPPLVERLRQGLGLSEDQTKKVAAIEAETREAAEQLKADAQAGLVAPEEARAKLRADREKALERVREVLTPEQREKLDAFVEKQKEQGDEGAAERARRRLTLEAVEKALGDAPAEEKKAILAAVRKLLDVRAAGEAAVAKARGELNDTAAKKAEKDEQTAKLAAFRSAREAAAAKVKQAETAVRDLLTVEQEVKLTGLGILD